MDKENIRSYLVQVEQLLREGKVIEAYETLGIVLNSLNSELRKEGKI